MKMRALFGLLAFFICSMVQGQITEPLAMNVSAESYHMPDTAIKKFSDSEEAGVAFLVNSNLKENKITIETNFEGFYKVRFIDYYAGSRKVYKAQHSNTTIDVSEFEKSIFILNITDQCNKVLTSQVVNLKRRHL